MPRTGSLSGSSIPVSKLSRDGIKVKPTLFTNASLMLIEEAPPRLVPWLGGPGEGGFLAGLGALPEVEADPVHPQRVCGKPGFLRVAASKRSLGPQSRSIAIGNPLRSLAMAAGPRVEPSLRPAAGLGDATRQITEKISPPRLLTHPLRRESFVGCAVHTFSKDEQHSPLWKIVPWRDGTQRDSPQRAPRSADGKGVHGTPYMLLAQTCPRAGGER